MGAANDSVPKEPPTAPPAPPAVPVDPPEPAPPIAPPPVVASPAVPPVAPPPPAPAIGMPPVPVAPALAPPPPLTPPLPAPALAPPRPLTPPLPPGPAPPSLAPRSLVPPSAAPPAPPASAPSASIDPASPGISPRRLQAADPITRHTRPHLSVMRVERPCVSRAAQQSAPTSSNDRGADRRRICLAKHDARFVIAMTSAGSSALCGLARDLQRVDEQHLRRSVVPEPGAHREAHRERLLQRGIAPHLRREDSRMRDVEDAAGRDHVAH